MKPKREALAKEKHRAAMRNHRSRKRQSGRVEIRLGWGSAAEQSALQVILTGLRNPTSVQQIQDLIADLRMTSRIENVSVDAAKSQSSSGDLDAVPRATMQNIGPEESPKDPVVQINPQSVAQPSISIRDFLER